MNQIPNIEESNTREVEEIVDENLNQISNYIFGRSISLQDSAKYERQVWVDTLYHQLQKARQDWLREEVVKLEGMKVCNDKAYRFPDAYVAEICYDKAIQTIIDRYQAELDQDNK